jgi:hypothetical protein
VSEDIDAVICHVAAFLMPVLEAARGAEPFGCAPGMTQTPFFWL